MAEHTVAITDQSFDDEVMKSTVPVLVDFWAPWCGPCIAISPVLDDLAKEYSGRLKIAKMNVDENANMPATFGVRSIPYMVLFKNGQMVGAVTGVQPKNKLKEFIERAF